MEGLLWFSGVSFTHILYSAFRTAYHDMAVANRMTPPQQPSSSSHSDAIEASVPLPLPTNVHELYQAIENRIQRDEGSRRIKDLVVEGELERIAEALSITAITNVVIITGFSCLIEHTPPTETDGPLGALAIAR